MVVEKMRFLSILQRVGIDIPVEKLLLDVNARIEAAILCAQKDAGLITTHIKCFNIANEEDRIKIAKICARQDGGKTAEYIYCFGIKNEAERIKISKLCARQNGGKTAECIQHFHITNEADRIEIAKLCAQHNSRETAFYIQNFGITNEADRIEIAKLCARQNGVFLASFIHKFEIVNEAERIKIAKLCILQDASSIVCVDSFEIESENGRIEIGKFSAQIDGAITAEYIQKFVIQNCQARLEVAKLCARQNGVGTALHVGQLNLINTRMHDIYVLCAIQNPKSLEHLSKIFAVYNSYSEIFKMDQSGEWNQDQALKILDTYIQDRLPHCNFEWVMPYLKMIKDPHAQRQLTVSLAAALFVLRDRLTDAQLIDLNNRHLTEAVYSIRSPSLYLSLIDGVSLLYSNEPAKELFQQQIPLDVEPKTPEWMIFAGVLLSQMSYRVEFLNNKKMLKLFKDGPKAQMLLAVLYNLKKETSLDPNQKQAVLDKIAASPDTYTTLRHLMIIFDLGEGALLAAPAQDIEAVALQAINSKIPVGNIRGGVVKIRETFGASREPDAIWRYAAKMRQTNDPRIMQCLAAFVSGVAEGTFLEHRYALDQNPHLSQLGAETVGRWRQSVSLASVEERGEGGFDPLDWLKLKILRDKHLDISQLDYLHRFLAGNNDSSVDQQLIQACKGKDPNGQLNFQKACIALAKASTPEDQRSRLMQVQRALARFTPRSELMNDVQGQLELMTSSQRKGSLAIDTDDPQHLLLCGTDVQGSCQRVDGDPSLNKGLLGYLMNGQTRLLAVIDEQGAILARSLIRLLWDGEKPVLFLERHYGDDQYAETILELAKAKAKQMGLTLTTLDKLEGDPIYDKPLYSLGGIAPFEYSDGDSGVKENSVFTIQDARVIAC